MIRTLLVDDAAVFRTGLRRLLEADGRFIVVGEAEDGVEAVAMATRLTPDLVVMDIRMPGLDGISAAREIRDGVPGAAVVILTECDSPAARADARAAGCAGYVLKRDDISVLPDRLISSIRRRSQWLGTQEEGTAAESRSS